MEGSRRGGLEIKRGKRIVRVREVVWEGKGEERGGG